MKTPLTLAVAAVACAAAAKPILVINEDNDHFFKLSPSLMTEQGVREYALDIFRGPVTHFFMCAQGQRASYDSKVWEPIWAGLNDPDNDGRTNNIWCVNAKRLFDAGIDPYRVWIGCAREKGVSPWMTMRMNDIHFAANPRYFRNTTFYKSHPEWRCVPGITGTGWDEYCLDYAHREVYDYHLAMAKELLDRYNVDGLELDWMRFTWYFKEGERRRNAHILTAFIGDVRAYADEVGKRRGRRILLGARVPALPVMCAEKGMDVEDWAAKRLIDWVVVHNQYGCTDFGIPFADWRDRLLAANPDLVLLPGCDHKYGTGGGKRERTMTADLYRGWAEALYEQGAKGLYLFNAPYEPKPIRDLLYGKGLAPELVRTSQRRYIASRHDTLPRGGLPYHQLPRRLDEDGFVSLRVGRPPANGGEVVLAFDRDDPAIDALTVLLNGEAPTGKPRALPAADFGFAQAKKALAFPFAAEAFVARENGVAFKRVPDSKAKVTWCEIRVKK